NATAELDGAGIRQDADVDFGQREAGMLLHDNDVGSEHDLEAAPTGDAVDGGDEWFVEVARIVQAAEAADSPVLVRLLASGCGLQIPTGAEEAVTCAGHDRDTQLRVV